MTEELEIIVNEEQFLADEELDLEEATIKCEDLATVVQTLKKVAAIQKAQGSNPLSMYTANECDILEERTQVIEAIAQLVPNHEERIQAIQACPIFNGFFRQNYRYLVDHTCQVSSYMITLTF